MQHVCSHSSSFYCSVQNSLLPSANGHCRSFVPWAITISVYNGFLTPDVFNYSKDFVKNMEIIGDINNDFVRICKNMEIIGDINMRYSEI